MEALKLKIVTPDKTVYDNDIKYVVVRTIAGDVGFMKRHTPYAGIIKKGMIKITELDDTKKTVNVSEGFVNTRNDEISVIVDDAQISE